MLIITASFSRKAKMYLEKIKNIVCRVFGEVRRSVKSGERRYVISALAIVSAFGIFFGFTFSGASVVYKINYLGKDIATVRNKDEFVFAKDTVVKLVKGSNVESAVATPEYKTVVALAPDINSENELINAIIDNTEEIVFGCEVSVGGQAKFSVDEETLNECMNSCFGKYDIEGTKCTHSFEEEVAFSKGYFLKNDVLNKDEVNHELNKLTVKTVSVKTEEVAIPYGTTQIKDTKSFIGSRKVMIDGVDGLANHVTTATYINGVLTGEPETAYEVVYAPVDEAVCIGVAVPTYTDDLDSLPGGGYVFPLPRGSWNVSAYYGDGRGHKGVDLCAKTGTPIYAVAAGKVIRAEWYSGYGYCIDVDHGFGFVTRYGHVSAMYASVGQTVQAGQRIALVGSTGNSSGSHLHIEFILGGKNLDPAFYLGLR